jgi:hypothetical protein
VFLPRDQPKAFGDSSGNSSVLTLELLEPSHLVDVENTYYPWRQKYGGLNIDQVRRLKQLEQENARLKRTVADLALDKQILKEAAEGNF